MHGDKPWYATAFDHDYPLMQTYEEALTPVQAGSVELLLNLPPRARILDLGCGYGRHCRIWRENGHFPVGLDLSGPLLALARSTAAGGLWVRGNGALLPFRPGSFDAVASMFISFGYFETQAQDLALLREARRVLRPGGGLYLEIKHPGYLRGHVPPKQRIPIGDAIVTETCRIVETAEGPRYEIRRALERRNRPVKHYHYSVRLYAPSELEALLREAGFKAVRLHGDYNGAPASPKHPRLIATSKNINILISTA